MRNSCISSSGKYRRRFPSFHEEGQRTTIAAALPTFPGCASKPAIELTKKNTIFVSRCHPLVEEKNRACRT
jgi:hypothetical protein